MVKSAVVSQDKQQATEESGLKQPLEILAFLISVLNLYVIFAYPLRMFFLSNGMISTRFFWWEHLFPGGGDIQNPIFQQGKKR